MVVSAVVVNIHSESLVLTSVVFSSATGTAADENKSYINRYHLYLHLTNITKLLKYMVSLENRVSMPSLHGLRHAI